MVDVGSFAGAAYNGRALYNNSAACGEQLSFCWVTSPMIPMYISLSVEQPNRKAGPGLGGVIQYCFTPTCVLDLEEIFQLPAINKKSWWWVLDIFSPAACNGRALSLNVQHNNFAAAATSLHLDWVSTYTISTTLCGSMSSKGRP